jgi:hypothetical protein
MHYQWVDRIAMAYLAQIEPPGCFFILLPSRKYRCFQALPTNKALFMAENRAAPPPKIHAIPIAIPATGASVQHLPQ